MCGIAGCVGHEHATKFVADSLEVLENRGYDSAGIAYPVPGGLEVVKALKDFGGVGYLKDHPKITENEATTSIGHTRWATHGKKTIPNSHPHTNQDNTIAVVHNGIIENHSKIRSELEYDGYRFSSETDTEVIPHLLDRYLKETGSPDEAFQKTVARLAGSYAILALFSDSPDALYAAKLSSPLVLGVNGGEHFAASTPNVITDKTKKFILLEDKEIAKISTDGYRSWHLESGSETTRKPTLIEDVNEKAELGDFPHFMLKEIYDAPQTVLDATRGRVREEENTVKLGGLEDYKEQLRRTERIVIAACGTSYHAGLIGQRMIEEIAGIPVEVHLASEFKYKNEPASDERETALIAISQSGETADTIEAIKKAREQGMLALGINNTPSSTIDRMTDAGVHCNAGEERSVASTKAFISQVAVLAEVAMALRSHPNQPHPLKDELLVLPDKINKILQDTSIIENVAKKYAHSKNFLYIGRGYEYASAMEGALKLKEISYINANGLAAGEMKHGTIALIDEDFPSFAIATDGPLYEKTLSNIQEIKASNGPVIVLANEGNSEISQLADDVLYVPKSLEPTQPILNGIAMQLFAYYVAVEKGLDVDRPRNLAKSVTVE